MENYTIIQNVDITSYLSDKAFRLYSLLQSMCYGEKDFCYPSQRYMSVALRCSVRSIQRTLEELKRNNLIVVRRRGSISNLYTIIAKKTKQAGEKVTSAIKGAYKAYKQKTKIEKQEKQSTFNNFKQRSYNFENLEQQLLGYASYDAEKLLE